MIHKVKYGWMEVIPTTSLDDRHRAPDLTFMGTDNREFAVFFAPFGTTDASAMLRAYYDYCAPFESEEEQDDAAVS